MMLKGEGAFSSVKLVKRANHPHDDPLVLKILKKSHLIKFS
jgi:hypothetical protein